MATISRTASGSPRCPRGAGQQLGLPTATLRSVELHVVEGASKVRLGMASVCFRFLLEKDMGENMREKNMGKLWFGVQSSYGLKKMLGRPMTWQSATWTCLNICRWPQKQNHVEICWACFWPLSEGSSVFEPCWRCIKMHDMKLKTPIPTSLLLDAGILSETYLRIGWHSEIKSILGSAVACYTTSACSFGTPSVKSTSHAVHRFTGQQILDPQMMESWPNFKASKQ